MQFNGKVIRREWPGGSYCLFEVNKTFVTYGLHFSNADTESLAYGFLGKWADVIGNLVKNTRTSTNEIDFIEVETITL